MKGERIKTKFILVFIPSRILFYAKIVKGERINEPHPILCKNSERRVNKQAASYFMQKKERQANKQAPSHQIYFLFFKKIVFLSYDKVNKLIVKHYHSITMTTRILYGAIGCIALLLSACSNHLQTILGDYSYKTSATVLINDTIDIALDEEIGSIDIVHIGDSTLLLTINELGGGIYTTHATLRGQNLLLEPYSKRITLTYTQQDTLTHLPRLYQTTFTTNISGKATQYEHTLVFDLTYQGISLSDQQILIGNQITMVAKKN